MMTDFQLVSVSPMADDFCAQKIICHPPSSVSSSETPSGYRRNSLSIAHRDPNLNIDDQTEFFGSSGSNPSSTPVPGDQHFSRIVNNQPYSDPATKFSLRRIFLRPMKSVVSFANFRSSSPCSTVPKMASSQNLTNIVRSKLHNSFPNLYGMTKLQNPALSLLRKENSSMNINRLIRPTSQIEEESIKKVLDTIASDHCVETSIVDNKIRRTVYIERALGEKFGFTLQSYSFRRQLNSELERCTYVDHVALQSPAFRAGLRTGDVIVAINGRNVQLFDHKTLVQYICDHDRLRMVVLYANCVNRIELCARGVKLKKLLDDKLLEYKMLAMQEDSILRNIRQKISESSETENYHEISVENTIYQLFTLSEKEMLDDNQNEKSTVALLENQNTDCTVDCVVNKHCILINGQELSSDDEEKSARVDQIVIVRF